METFKRLQAERTHLRRIFTISANKVEDVFKSGKSDDIFLKFAELADKAERLFKIDSELNNLIYENVVDDTSLEAELNQIEVYRERWVNLVAKRDLMQQAERNHDHVSDTGCTSVGTGCTVKLTGKFKLPKLQLRTFDGSVKGWLKFWAFFKKIDADQSIDDDIKFEYLIQSMKDGSPTWELVNSFPPTAINYTKAVEALRQRFGRDELLIEYYIRGILGLVLRQSSGGDVSLDVLYDKLETQLRSLESLGVTSEKYASMLLPLAESALPDTVLRLWERSRNTSETAADHSNQLKELLCFLRKEVEGEKRVSMARETFSKMDTNDSLECGESKFTSSSYQGSQGQGLPTAADLTNHTEQTRRMGSCVFCSKSSHESSACFKAMDLTKQEVEAVLKKRGYCFSCMKGTHRRQECKVAVRCVICHGRHAALLCGDRKVSQTPKETPVTPTASDTVEQMLSNVCLPNVLMQTLEVVVRGDTEIKARVLIDTGSQRSYVTRRMVAKLGYAPVGQELLIHGLFGGSKSGPTPHSRYKVRLLSVSGKYACCFDALDADTICQAVPVAAKGPWLRELASEGITLSDVTDGPIDILVGADIAGKLWTGKMKVLSSGLVAVETFLGWTLMGKVGPPAQQTTCDTYLAMFCADASPAELWDLEVLGIQDPAQGLSKLEKWTRAREHFDHSVQVLCDGRYQVRLPWLDDHPPLQRNFNVALTRLEKTLHKLRREGMEKAYFGVLEEWLHDGVIEEVPIDNWDCGHYLPHRAVYKEGSTTPVRPVFDASSREKGHPSLNQCLETGPTLLEQIPSLLLRFRLGKIGIVADVKRAFLQIAHEPEDRDFLRFLWMNEDGALRIFRHARVVFGVRSSPFLLGAVLEHLLNQCKLKIQKGELRCPLQVVNLLENSLYVDNFVGSLHDLQDVQMFIENARSLFQLGRFDLRGWEHTDETLEHSTETSVLGLIWDRKGDTLQVRVPDFKDISESSITKRTLSSTFQRIFDPLGLTSPVTVLPKRLLQRAWSVGGGWEDVVDDDVRDQILNWISDMSALNEITVPRCLFSYGSQQAVTTLHVFCDASQVAYAAVVYVRTESQGMVQVQQVASKSRIAPNEKISIPRLELLAATIAARLGHNTFTGLDCVETAYYWTDSSTVLTWIQREEPWAVFVGNRVAEIRKLTNKDSWRHIPGNMNPADLASRGSSARHLVQQKWWLGPEWLTLPECQWPRSLVVVHEEEVMAERRKTVVSALVQSSPTLSSAVLTRRFSGYQTIVNIVGWMFRFLFNRYSKKRNYSGPLSVEEIERAERVVLRVIQDESFEGKDDRQLRKLKPQVDAAGLIRLRTRIWARKDTELFRAPYILPSNHKLVEKLIMQTHLDNGHIVGQSLLNVLRERFWILKGRQTIKRVVSSCIRCKRVAARALDAETPPLPENRVRDARVFEVCGTDFAGPLYLRNGDKVWICIFTCAIYRAVYLDTVTSLSTEAFTLAFRRFVARHGRPSVVYSDNGTNFRGLTNMLSGIDWDNIMKISAVQRIEWRFHPPTGSWWGGFWERLIGVVKVLLRKILGQASLTMEELTTIVHECASYVNARPITFMSADPSDPVPVTPNMLLSDVQEVGLPDFDLIDVTSLEKRVRLRIQTMKSLRERFRSEYLGQLNLSHEKLGNCRVPKVGELVLIGSDNKKRLDWPLAVIQEVIKGCDGNSRVVKLRTADGTLTRPIQRVYPLEIQLFEETVARDNREPISGTSATRHPDQRNQNAEEAELPSGPGRLLGQDMEQEGAGHRPPGDEEDVTTNSPVYQEVTTRCGRRVKLPVKYR